MTRPLTALLLTCFILGTMAVAAAPARAHFPWLATDAEGHALLYFGESPADRVYHMPDAVAAAKVMRLEGDAEPKEIELAAVETDDFVGRKSEAAVPADAALESEIRYGIYHGMLLDYYAKHLSSLEGAGPKSGLKLNVVPELKDGKLQVTVTWDGKPAAKTQVTLVDADAATSEGETDDNGVATFDLPGDGLIGLLVARTDGEAKGEHDGERYTSAAAYGTVTFVLGDASAADDAAAAAPATEPTSTTAAVESALTPLPEPVASFGAAVSDGWLYVYSGHIGEEHAHSRDNLSNHFRRIALDGSGEWEELPMQLALQGLPLVAHGGKLYRVGGLTFRNAAEDDPDMHSVAEFACFDPTTNEWTALAPLPEARSSHDAVVIGDTLYVIGGWTLAGESEGDWLDTAWSMDLTNPEAEWQAVATPTFKRRALAAGQWNGQLVAIGGMDETAKVSRRVDALDPATGEWTRLDDLPRSQMAGFGVSAWNLDGKLLVSGADGVMHQLSDDGKTWKNVGKLATGRFFHRLMPGVGSSLLVVAGASVDAGHLATVESFSPAAKN